MRRHILADPASLGEIARFLVNTLLLSHSIRRDTVAIALVGDRVLVAPGSTLRQLRPDQESAEGWLRAVLRGKARGLGAFLESADVLDRALSDATLISTCEGDPRPPKPHSLEHPVNILHGPSNPRKCWLSAPCKPACRAALANIVLDRIQRGLKP